MNEGRPFIRGSKVPMDSPLAFVLSSIPMAQWDNNELVPSGNGKFLEVARGHIDAYLASFPANNPHEKSLYKSGQELALEILQDPSLDGMQYFVPLDENGEMVHLGAWQSLETELSVFTSSRDGDVLKKFLEDPINRECPFMLGEHVTMNSNKYVVLSGLPILQWDDNTKVPAGNKTFRKIAKEYIENNTEGLLGQNLTKKILKDDRVCNELIFLVPLNKSGKKVTLKWEKEAWIDRRLTIFKSSKNEKEDGPASLKEWLTQPVKTMMKNINPQPINPESKEPARHTKITPVDLSERIDLGFFQAKIAECETIDKLHKLFDAEDKIKHGCLGVLQDIQGKHKEKWACEWAQKLRKKDPSALEHDRRRLVLRTFWHKVVDMGFSEDGKIIQEQNKSLMELRHILTNILQVLLPMGRAKAIYFLYNKLTCKPGNHWYAEEHTDKMKRLRLIPDDYDGEQTTNHRYDWLLKSGLISAFVSKKLKELLKPAMCPLIQLDRNVIKGAERQGILDLRSTVQKTPPAGGSGATKRGPQHAPGRNKKRRKS